MIAYTCPYCGKEASFWEAIVNDGIQYTCPKCKIVRQVSLNNETPDEQDDEWKDGAKHRCAKCLHVFNPWEPTYSIIGYLGAFCGNCHNAICNNDNEEEN